MKRHTGQSLLEVLLAIAIFILGFVTLSAVFIDSGITNRDSIERSKANRLALEGLEATRSIRDRSFAELTTGTKGLIVTGGQWFFSGTSDTQGGYTRSIEISAPASDYRFVTSTVSWVSSNGLHDVTSFVTYLSDWQAKTGGSWQEPVVAATTTLPGNISALSVEVYGNRLYVTTPVNPAGPEFLVYDISNEIDPIYLGGLELGKTIFTTFVSGTRAYLASDDNPDEIKIVDVASSTNPTLLGSIKLTGNSNVTSIEYYDSNLVHFTRERQGKQNTYFIYNVADPTSPFLLGGLYLGGGGKDLALVRPSSPPVTILATDVNTQEFETVNTSNPSSMAVGGSINLSGTEDALSCAASGTTYGFLGSAQRNTTQEFFTLNISNITAPTTLGSFEIDADVNRMTRHPATPGLVYLATASSTAEFIIMDVSNVFNPVVYGSADLSAVATDVAVSTSTAYITTQDPSAALMIIQGGP